jgi:hypothetical protein
MFRARTFARCWKPAFFEVTVSPLNDRVPSATGPAVNLGSREVHILVEYRINSNLSL